VIQKVPLDHSNDRHGFLTILDSVVTVGESAGRKEQAGQTQPQLGGLLKGAGGGMKNGMAADFSEALVVRAL
jgi:hypothetical protein